ncbi:hypothetical protein [Murinocardiopsis flavida]|uniref:hypothetical protein n=1 Tax=Murinocardiopsis flavida TaxID=645275 RepID=UPI001B800B6F|nr:hypothetical protein [Murinocardiopsis flavida]
MRGGLATKCVKGESLPQWQLEVTGGGRIWYAVDEGRRLVWISLAGPGHPRATDRTARAR